MRRRKFLAAVAVAGVQPARLLTAEAPVFVRTMPELQAAMASGARWIRMGPGEYRFAAGSLPPGMRLEGAGAALTRLSFGG
jgi:hypothetical protein